MNITVYLGSSQGNDELLSEKVIELGTWIGQSGHRLVYGGSKPGLMGMLAKSTMDAGGYVMGVESKFFVDMKVAYEGLSEMVVYDDRQSRISRMEEEGDVFIAFPGGLGTLEEISIVMVDASLGIKKAPCIFYNINGYYEGLRTQLEKMTEKKLSTKDKQKYIYFASSLEEIKAIILQ